MQTENQSSKPKDSPEQKTGEGCQERLVRHLPFQRRTDELKVWPASQFKPYDMVLDKEQGEKLKIAAVELDAELGRAWAEIKRLRRVMHAIADSRPDEYMDVEKTPKLVKWICETCRNARVGAYPPNA
jgi:hypothetical protein